jgi:hypothetical protein
MNNWGECSSIRVLGDFCWWKGPDFCSVHICQIPLNFFGALGQLHRHGIIRKGLCNSNPLSKQAQLAFWRDSVAQEPILTIASHNAMRSLVRFEIKIFSCSCKFKSRRIGSWFIYCSKTNAFLSTFYVRTSVVPLIGWIVLFAAGLPDGLFSNQKSQFGYIFRGPWYRKMLVCFMTICNILRPFGKLYGSLVYIVCGNLVYLSHFGNFLERAKSGNPALYSPALPSRPSIKTW